MSNWKNIIGKQIFTADQGPTPGVYQPFNLPTSFQNDMFLKGVGIAVIAYNSPIYTTIGLEIWSSKASAPSALLASALNTWTSAEILTTQAYGLKYIGFTFDPFPLKKGITYQLAIRLAGYTGDSTSHIAWKHTYPDPAYVTGYTMEAKKAGVSPLEASIFAAVA